MDRFLRLYLPMVVVLLVLVFVVVEITLKKPTRANSQNYKSVVTNVTVGGLKDIVISLVEIRGIFLLKDGINRGLNAGTLKEYSLVFC